MIESWIDRFSIAYRLFHLEANSTVGAAADKYKIKNPWHGGAIKAPPSSSRMVTRANLVVTV